MQIKFVCHQPLAIRALFSNGYGERIIRTYKTHKHQDLINIDIEEGWGIGAAFIDPLVSGFWHA
jgi:hypothetical protein